MTWGIREDRREVLRGKEGEMSESSPLKILHDAPTSFWSSSQQKQAIVRITPFDDADNVEFLSLFLAFHLHRV